jgi:hypothetical protein
VGRVCSGAVLGALIGFASCSTSGADETSATSTTGGTAEVDPSTSSTTNLTTPTTGISDSVGPDGTTTDAGAGSTSGGSEATSAPAGSSSSGGSTGPMCPNAPDDGSYTTCVQGFFCPGGGSCLEDAAGTFQVCTRGCFDVCNCWPTPDGDHTAAVACRDDVLASGSLTCVLDCSNGETCPTDSWCHPQLEVCVFDTPSGGSSTGGSTGAE